MSLQPRQRALLAAVIERYVQDAEPVGSATLAAEGGEGHFGHVSSATIRNELAELEAAGYLAHPHTSAGRVPTDAGYRFYVNEILRPRPLRAAEQARIRERIATPATSIEDALRSTTAALAELTGYPAVASLPTARRDTMRHVQLNPVPPRHLILVLMTATGRIEHRLFEIEDGVPSRRLTEIVNFLNENLGGRTLEALRRLEFDSVSAGLHEAATIALARLTWDQVRLSLQDLGDERIVVQGMIALFDEPEFADIDQARAAMRLFENEEAMGEVLRGSLQHVSGPLRRGQGARHSIVIGREHARADNPAVERFSFVGIAYSSNGEVLGTVGVMGPTRMKYADAVSLVPALAARLQASLETL